MDFGGGEIEPEGDARDPYAVSFDRDGAFMWARFFPTEGSGWPEALVADSSGAIALAGTRAITEDGRVRPSAYLFRVEPDGTVAWQEGMGGYTESLAFTDTGRTVLGGRALRHVTLSGRVVVRDAASVLFIGD